ncbi:unnamed protein product, partial [Nesidiocoris tenuis]
MRIIVKHARFLTLILTSCSRTALLDLELSSTTQAVFTGHRQTQYKHSMRPAIVAALRMRGHAGSQRSSRQSRGHLLPPAAPPVRPSARQSVFPRSDFV